MNRGKVELSEESRRYEIEPRPAAVDGGWMMRLFDRDWETGEEVEVGATLIPLVNGEVDMDYYTGTVEMANDWINENSQR